MASSGFYTFSESTGLITPNTQDLLDTVQQEYVSAFGSGLVLTGNTPQGVLINAETLARTRVLQLNATMGNQINPNFAGGIFLDSILALTGSQRTASLYTVVNVTVTGVIGTIIPIGSLVQDTLGNLYATLAAVTIAIGINTVSVQAVASGPIVVAIGAISIIVTNTLGWETVTNPAIQTFTGSTTQSDVSARTLRQNTLALQGQSLSQAITSGVFAVPGVTSLFYQQNDTPAPAVINGVNMIANSLYLCVDGGSATAIAYELNQKKSGGCAYNNAIAYSGLANTIGSFTETGTVVGPFNVTGCTVTMGSNVITNVSSTTGVFAGQTVSGLGIPSGAVVLSFIVNTSVTISVLATFTSIASATITFGASQSIAVASTTNMFIGQTVTGTGIPAGSLITAIVTNTSISINMYPTASGTPTLTFGNTPFITGISGSPTLYVGGSITGANIPTGSVITAILSASSVQISNLVTGSATGESIIIYGGVGQDIPITDPYSLQTVDVLFDTPSYVPIAVQVTAQANSSLLDIVGTIQQAVVDYANGVIPGDPGLTVGTAVSCFAIAGAISIRTPSIYITSVQTSLFPIVSYSSASIPIAVFQRATIVLSSVSVVLV